ncbi:hypothetical protein [Haloferax sulfurifontis]|uniref:Uncharacterized protein n=2 Tax=Haloferax sulfurifontis TaxID=255616 RepID=M0IMB2_9EURY|nr:hypothetical protein [Haloferax sulfurifontis]ELZ96589.1 hypothetical protein C441_04454 [Haloferax sulfurifontis ATCC BAA-897]GGC72635.1 hypothetical protein GCM10007209_38240 [Haloferax sulfurifontis]
MSIRGQLSGFARNAWGYATNWSLDDILLPSIVDTINWIASLVPRALGIRQTTPREQINANIVFIFFWATLSVISFGATLALVFVHLFLLGIGVWRWLPAFNELWRRGRSRLPIPDDIDIPFWRSE